VWPVFHASPKDWRQGLDATTQDPNRAGLLTFQPEPYNKSVFSTWMSFLYDLHKLKGWKKVKSFEQN
jgi:hypothetical protein